MQVVKAHGSEEFEHDRVEERSDVRRLLGVEVSRAEGRLSATIDLLSALAAALVLVFGFVRVSTGALSAGDLVVFTAYAAKTYRPLRDIARQSSRIARSLARADRIAEILTSDEALPEAADAHAGGRAAGRVQLVQRAAVA